MIHIVLTLQRCRGQPATRTMGQIRAAHLQERKGCAGAEAMHLLPGRINNNINIAIPCSHLPLTAKRNSDSGGVGEEG